MFMRGMHIHIPVPIGTRHIAPVLRIRPCASTLWAGVQTPPTPTVTKKVEPCLTVVRFYNGTCDRIAPQADCLKADSPLSTHCGRSTR
jgi:hypothetical protein